MADPARYVLIRIAARFAVPYDKRQQGRIFRGTEVQRLLARLGDNDRAATTIEYALIVAAVSIIVVTSVHILGNALSSTFARASALFQITADDDP